MSGTQKYVVRGARVLGGEVADLLLAGEPELDRTEGRL